MGVDRRERAERRREQGPLVLISSPRVRVPILDRLSRFHGYVNVNRPASIPGR